MSFRSKRPMVLKGGRKPFGRWSSTWPSTPAVTMWVPLPSTAMQVSGPCTTSRPHLLDAAAEGTVATWLRLLRNARKLRSLRDGGARGAAAVGRAAHAMAQQAHSRRAQVGRPHGGGAVGMPQVKHGVGRILRQHAAGAQTRAVLRHQCACACVLHRPPTAPPPVSQLVLP